MTAAEKLTRDSVTDFNVIVVGVGLSARGQLEDSNEDLIPEHFDHC